jgi:hypothetical protein
LSKNHKNECLNADLAKVGLIYLFLPSRTEINGEINRSNDSGGDDSGAVFKLHNYYSLMVLASFFKPQPNDRLLFYYVNKNYMPISNHYHRWLNDSFWSSKVPLDAIKFINLNYTWSKNDQDKFDMYETVAKVINRVNFVNEFDKKKEYYLFITSDIILGPKTLTCFTGDMRQINSHPLYSIESIRAKIGDECYASLHESKNSNQNEFSYVSFFYKLELIHNLNDFSGVLLWRSFVSENSTIEKLTTSVDGLKRMIKHENNFKCHYKTDVFKSTEISTTSSYENTYCVFGYEFHSYDAPLIQNLFTGSDYFSQLMRKKFYGHSSPITHNQSLKLTNGPARIPNIVHMIWFSHNYRGLKFIEYLCLKSILAILKPDKIKIHGDNPPSCDLWKEISKHPKIEWVEIERPLHRYGQNFSDSPVQHLADIARLEALYEEGGIYSDFDVIWVKSVESLRYMNVQVIAANDITSYCSEFPFNIQIGVFLAAPKSEFVKMWLDGYKNYHLYPNDYVAISMCEPYKIYEKYPQRVFIENRLQMIFFNGWNVFIPRLVLVLKNKIKNYYS